MATVKAEGSSREGDSRGEAGAEDQIVTLSEVIRQTEALEEEAEAKMQEDWGEENVCTYGDGYIDQPIYSCLSCAAQCGRSVGVCYGCYLSCHLEHETIELFSKRGFRWAYHFWPNL